MPDQTQINFYIIVGALTLVTSAMLLITIFYRSGKRIREKENEKQLEVFASASEAEEKQREEIGKNLHDGIIPNLSAVERSLDKNIKDFGTDKFDLERLAKDVSLIEQTIENIRRVSHDLFTKELMSLGVIDALKEYLEQISSGSIAETGFENFTKFTSALPFSEVDQLHIYRICQELLNNLVKHASFKFVKLSVENTEIALELVLMHDGNGITNQQIESFRKSSKGVGLKSLQKRCLILKAQINYTIEENFSFIIFSVPFKT